MAQSEEDLSRKKKGDWVPDQSISDDHVAEVGDTAVRARRFRVWVVPLLLLAHIFTVSLSMLISYWERFYVSSTLGILPPVDPPGLALYAPGLLGGATIIVAVFSYLGAYRNRRRFVRDADYTTAVKACTIALVLEVALSFFTKSTHYSRLIFVLSWGNSVLLFYMTIFLLGRLQRVLVRKGLALSRFLILGHGENARALKRRLELDAELGKEFVGFVTANGEDQPRIGTNDVVAGLKQIGSAISKFKVDHVYIACRDLSHTEILEILDQCTARQAQAHMLSDIYELLHGRASVEQVAGVPMVSLREVALRRRQEMIKRGMDIAISLLLMMVAVPLGCLIGFAILIDSPGRLFYSQVRVGKDGKRFRMYKFRSMSLDADQKLDQVRSLNEAEGLIFKIRQDPRVTRVGSFLRKTSLDELPQILNVLRGDMSLVGPRPPLPSEVEAYEKWHHKRLTVNQGMTGLWQVSGRSLLSFEEMVNLDIYYIENWSIWMDLLILLRTMPIVLMARGAY